MTDDTDKLRAEIGDLYGRCQAVAVALDRLLATYDRLGPEVDLRMVDDEFLTDLGATLKQNCEQLGALGWTAVGDVLLEIADRIIETVEAPPPRYHGAEDAAVRKIFDEHDIETDKLREDLCRLLDGMAGP